MGEGGGGILGKNSALRRVMDWVGLGGILPSIDGDGGDGGEKKRQRKELRKQRQRERAKKIRQRLNKRWRKRMQQMQKLQRKRYTGALKRSRGFQNKDIILTRLKRRKKKGGVQAKPLKVW
jgi:hypothetical protein